MKPQVFVSGGTRGIGQAICGKLAEKGFEVAFTYKSSASQAEAFAADLAKRFATRVEAFQMDLTQVPSIESASDKILASFPNLTALVNNAGVSVDGLIARYKPEQFDEVVGTNLRGAFFATQSLLRPLLKARSGSIVFMTSVVGQSGNAGQTAYAASKAGLIGIAKSLAQELSSRSIRVNCVSPGFIQTDMTQALPEATKQSILTKIPLGTFGSTDDVANAVAFLLGPESKYITGQVLAVNGGMYM